MECVHSDRIYIDQIDQILWNPVLKQWLTMLVTAGSTIHCTVPTMRFSSINERHANLPTKNATHPLPMNIRKNVGLSGPFSTTMSPSLQSTICEVGCKREKASRCLLVVNQGLALLTLSWDKNWDSHSLVNGYPSFYPRIALVAPSPGKSIALAFHLYQFELQKHTLVELGSKSKPIYKKKVLQNVVS